MAEAKRSKTRRTGTRRSASSISKRGTGARNEAAKPTDQAKIDRTKEAIAAQLDEDRALAHDKGQAGAAVQASMGKAKLLGLIAAGAAQDAPDATPTEVASARKRLARRLAGIAARIDAGEGS